MHKFQQGDKASVMKDGAEVEMTVFYQSGELVSLCDRTNRYYLFHIMELHPVRNSLSSISMGDALSEATMREHSSNPYLPHSGSSKITENGAI